MEPARRIGRLPQQFFADLVELAEERAAQGRPVINLGQGNPDQPTPPHIVDALKTASEDARLHRYIAFSGLDELKTALTDWYRIRHQVTLNPQTEVAILIGSKVGLGEISLAVLNPGDRVLVSDPGYPDYRSGIALAGGELKPLPLRAENGFAPDPDDFDKSARLAFLNFPNNPTGRLISPETLQVLVDRARRTGMVLAHDLCYGDIVFDGKKAMSLLAMEGGKDVGVEFTTLSKTYHMAGWRVGFAAGRADVIGWITRLQDHLHCGHFGPVQMAAVAALKSPPEIVETTRQLYQTRRDAFVDTACAQGWQIPPSEGSIFVWCPVPASRTSREWSREFLLKSDVVTAPGTGFGPLGEGFVRVALTQPADRLAEAARRMARLIGEGA